MKNIEQKIERLEDIMVMQRESIIILQEQIRDLQYRLELLEGRRKPEVLLET